MLRHTAIGTLSILMLLPIGAISGQESHTAARVEETTMRMSSVWPKHR
jgi:hypothetical protein